MLAVWDGFTSHTGRLILVRTHRHITMSVLVQYLVEIMKGIYEAYYSIAIG